MDRGGKIRNDVGGKEVGKIGRMGVNTLKRWEK
jgi:hypothetical protein